MAKIHLTNAEKETIFLTSEADDYWEIYTFNEKLIRRLDKYSNDHSDCCELMSSDDELGCRTYKISKKRMAIQLTAPYSEERKQSLREAGKKNIEALYGNKD